jgi:HEAT repeat protein
MKRMLLITAVSIAAAALVAVVLVALRPKPRAPRVAGLPHEALTKAPGCPEMKPGRSVGGAVPAGPAISPANEGVREAQPEEAVSMEQVPAIAAQPEEGERAGVPLAAAAGVDEALLKALKDDKTPVPERKMKMEELAAKGDETSVRTLMALGDEETYLNFAAVEVLGKVRNPALRTTLADYFRGKLGAQDLKVLSAAITSYGRLMGHDAVAALAEVIRNNRVRGDGFETMVLTAAVETLGQISSAAAAPVLIEELERSEEKGWSLEYGSAVVEALGRLNTAEGNAALLAYAARLEARRPNDPLAGAYFDGKIAETRRAAGKM